MNTLPKILIIADGFGVPSYNPRLRALCDYLYAQGYPITVVVEHIADLPFKHDYPVHELRLYTGGKVDWAVKNIWAMLQLYRRLNAKALEKMPHGSILFTFSCSQAVNKEQFRLAVFSAAAQTRRKVRILHQLTQPADHPINIYHPEGEYLKGLVLYVE